MLNALKLYFRHGALLILGLYLIRLLIQTLGVDDYAVYVIIWTTVLGLSFFSASLASSTQRFMSFWKAKNYSNINVIFSNILVLYFASAVALFLTLNFISVNVISIYTFENITFAQAERFIRFASVIIVFMLFSSMYAAILVSFEDFKNYSVISIFEVLMRLLSCFMASFAETNRLEIFLSFLIALTCA